MKRTKYWRAAGILAAGSMMLAACSGGAQQVIKETVIVEQDKVVEVTKQIEVTATTEPTPGPTSVPEAQPSDTVIIAMQQEPDTLHPLIGSMQARAIVLGALSPGCMGQNEKTEWIPFGCESVPTLENGGAQLVGDGADRHLELTYKIRTDWRWTDGVPVTAQDVLYAWKLIMNPDFEIADRTSVEKVYSIEAVDDHTVLVKLLSENQIKQAIAGTLSGDVPFEAFKEDYAANYTGFTGPAVDAVYWAYPFPGWLPSHILESIGVQDQAASDYAKAPVGDGAYVVTEWVQGQEIILQRSDQPFPLGEPKVNTIIFRFFGDSAGVKAALQNGEVDAAVGNIAGLSPADAPDLDKLEATGMYKINWLAGYSWEHIDLNTTKAPLDDPRVRQALYYATDRKAIADALYFGKINTVDLPGGVAQGTSWAYTDNYTKYSFDPDKAKALLQEAGWDCAAVPCTKTVTENGQEVTKNLEFTLMTTDRADRQSLAQVIQNQWKSVGFGVNLVFLYGRGLFTPASQGGPLYGRSFDAAIYTAIGGDDPQFTGQYNCAAIPAESNSWSGQNYPGYCNEQADQALNQSETNVDVTLSREKRKPFIETFFQEWTKDVPVIPLFAATEPYVYRSGFKNFKPGLTQYATAAWNAWEWEIAK
ncbi:MAG: peptide ABC transporter substrate-binding protein [Chloroflexi bacterium]|nr:peptide ABC transporter substrate-binding protein [Chloroflexota bacterium]